MINFSFAGEELEVRKGNNENSVGENMQRSFIFEAITTFSMYFLVIAAFSKVLTCTHVFRQISQVMSKKKKQEFRHFPAVPPPPRVSYEQKLPYHPTPLPYAKPITVRKLKPVEENKNEMKNKTI